MRDYGALHEIRIEHVYETFYVLILGIVGYLRTHPDVDDEVLKDLICLLYPSPCSRAHLAHRHRRRPSAQGGRAQSRARPPPAHRLTRTPSAHGSPMPDFRMQKPSPHRKKDEQDARTFFLPPLAVKYWR